MTTLKEKAQNWKTRIDGDKFLADRKDNFALSNRAWEFIEKDETSLKCFCEKNNINYKEL